MARELGESFSLAVALKRGMLPVVWGAVNPESSVNSYAALYLREEVQAEGLVRSTDGFSRFLEAISFSHASVLSISEIARECQIGRKTVETHIAILEDLLLGYRLPVFTKRARRHLISHPKFYFFDCGVFRSVRPSGPLDRPEEIEGAALEGLVAQHLRCWIAYGWDRMSLSFWRTKSGTEVDFILHGPEGMWAIETKNSAMIRPRDLVGLRSFREDYPEAASLMLYRGDERLLIDGILCLPCESFLSRLQPGLPLPM
jgi:predicted AAA+ superfamily ATPase